MSARTKMVASKIDTLGNIGIGSFWYGANGGVDYQVQIHPESPYPTDLRLAPILLNAYNTLTGMDSTLLSTLNILNARTEAQMGDDAWQAQIDSAEANSMLFLWGSVRDGGCCILKKDDGYIYLYVSYGKVYNQTLDTYTYHMEQINWIESAWDYNSCYFAFQYQFVAGTYLEAYHYYPYIDTDRGQMFCCCFAKSTEKRAFNFENRGTSIVPQWVATETRYETFDSVFNTGIIGYNLGLNPDGTTFFNMSPVFARTYMCRTAGNGTSPIWEFPPQGWEHVEGSSIWGGASVPDSPDNNGGGGGEGGGGGQYDDDDSNGNTPEDLPDLDVDILDTGFVSLYNPSTAQLKDLAAFLFTGITENIAIVLKRLVANPLDYIVSLNLCHLNLTSESSEFVKFGGVNTNVSMPKLANQFLKLKGGTCTIDERKQTMSFLDYAPNCQCKIWIPYCGMHELPIELVMGSTMQLYFIVDLLSGSVTANLYISRNRRSVIGEDFGLENAYNNQQLFTYTGNCFEPLPVANLDYRNVVNGVLGLAGGLATSIATGNPIPMISSGVAGALNSKPHIQTSGSTGSCYGYMNAQRPYIVFSRPIPAMSNEYGMYEGYPSISCKKVTDFTGYLEILKGTFWCGSMTTKYGKVITSSEADELEQILENGIYIYEE